MVSIEISHSNRPAWRQIICMHDYLIWVSHLCTLLSVLDESFFLELNHGVPCLHCPPTHCRMHQVEVNIIQLKPAAESKHCIQEKVIKIKKKEFLYKSTDLFRLSFNACTAFCFPWSVFHSCMEDKSTNITCTSPDTILAAFLVFELQVKRLLWRPAVHPWVPPPPHPAYFILPCNCYIPHPLFQFDHYYILILYCVS